MLLGVWCVGSRVGGVWFGTRRPALALPKQFSWVDRSRFRSFVVLAVMPTRLALGVALVVGGTAIAPALTVENNLVSRLAPAATLNEAYTWVITVAVSCSAAGGAVAGVIVDRPGGVPWVFVLAGLLVVASMVGRGDRPGRWPGRTGARPSACAMRSPPPGDLSQPVRSRR